MTVRESSVTGLRCDRERIILLFRSIKNRKIMYIVLKIWREMYPALYYSYFTTTPKPQVLLFTLTKHVSYKIIETFFSILRLNFLIITKK